MSTGGATAVVTGAKVDEDAEAPSAEPTLKWDDRPLIVYVCDEAAGCEGLNKLEDVVLKDEKVALGLKAFRRVKMHPDNVEADPILKDHGREVPRMLVVEPRSMKITVLQKGRLKASRLFRAMERAARKSYEERLKRVVDTHLKLLTEQDQLANAEKVLLGKQARLADDEGRKAEREKKELGEELTELRKEMAALAQKQKELWKLTPRERKTA